MCVCACLWAYGCMHSCLCMCVNMKYATDSLIIINISDAIRIRIQQTMCDPLELYSSLLLALSFKSLLLLLHSCSGTAASTCTYTALHLLSIDALNYISIEHLIYRFIAHQQIYLNIHYILHYLTIYMLFRYLFYALNTDLWWRNDIRFYV